MNEQRIWKRMTLIDGGGDAHLPYSRALQCRHTCLFARQMSRHHIAPSCATTHPNVGGMHRYCLGLPVVDYLQRPTCAPSPKQSVVLMGRTAARRLLWDCSDVHPLSEGRKGTHRYWC